MDEHARSVRDMFSAIAPHYDFLNHLLSLNIDRIWRRRAVDHLSWRTRPAGLYLDACAGTFDLALELAVRPGFAGRIVAGDFARAMLSAGRDKIGTAPVMALCADTLEMPFASGAIDGAMVGFGLRNLSDIDAGLREFRRVLRPDARLVILDFATPRRQPLRGLYLFYFRRVLPLIGRLVSKHSFAYSYLPDSVLRFSAPDELAGRLRDTGFVNVGFEEMTGGIACVWWGARAS